MAVLITGEYTGDLKMRARHEQSGTELSTAAPLDNRGDGSSFSPTDLTATSLATCVVTVMAIAARDHDIPFDGASFRIEKHMASGPRRIARLPLTITMPPGLDADQRKTLERAGLNCPIHHSLHPDIEADVTFEYSD